MSRLRKVLDPTRTGKDAESLEKTLLRMVVGQDEAVEQIVNIYQMHLTGLSAPSRPVGNFLFLGPTGSGKTRTVEATAEALVNNPRAVIKIDCAEFQHSHEIAKLIGSPPGYLGHRETHPLLSQEVINQHHTDSMKLSFILFDEMNRIDKVVVFKPLGQPELRRIDLELSLKCSRESSILQPNAPLCSRSPTTVKNFYLPKAPTSNMERAT